MTSVQAPFAEIGTASLINVISVPKKINCLSFW